MRLYSLSFLAGILLLQFFSVLPSKIVLGVLALFFVFSLFFKFLRLVSAFLFGFVWCLCYLLFFNNGNLPANWEGKNLLATGYVASIPMSHDHQVSFLFSLQSMKDGGAAEFPARGLVKLSLHGSQVLHAGEKWKFKVRLKRVHGTSNPGSFDYEAWALQAGIVAQGYVVKSYEGVLLENSKWHFPLLHLREVLKTRIESHLPVTNTSPWIVALTVGERQGIAAENWDVLRNTGTNHLMAIAGLHIGFMAGFVYAVVLFLWRRLPRFILFLPAQHAAAIAGLLMAFFYSALAGFLLPTQRACLMFAIAIVIVLLRRKTLAWQVWCLALVGVLLLNPLCVLSESFWLSFGAVALIIYGVSGRLGPHGWFWKWGRIQWVISLGLVPLSLWLFQQWSLVSLVANSIAIPWVGLLVVPLSLLGVVVLCFSVKLGGVVLVGADRLLGYLWVVLGGLAHLPWAAWYHVPVNQFVLWLACGGVVLLLLPRGFPGKYLGCFAFLPLLFVSHGQPKVGEVELSVLDVGQGLATVVRTAQHVLVFDTGAKLGEHFDMGASVVVPFLRSLGVGKVDLLVVSHGDNDHRGGAEAVLRSFSVGGVKSSVPGFFSNSSFCLRGESWSWDGVVFKFLYPFSDTLGLGNDSSCVLWVSNGVRSFLLTGDIEKFAERRLVGVDAGGLRASVLVAPHHGSKTSAVEGFVGAVRPAFVVFSTGYRNRYHFPHGEVVGRYVGLGARPLNTAVAGAVQFVLHRDGGLSSHLYRVEHKRYWFS